VQAQLMHS